MTTDVAERPVQSGAVPSTTGTRQFQIEGSMPLGIEDLRPPILKIVQGLTRNVDKKRLGEYHLSLDDSYHETFAAVLVGLTNKSRAYRKSLKDGGKLDDPPLCASDDAIAPRSAEQAASVGAAVRCDACPFSRFGSNGEAPPCQEQWNFLGLTYDDEPVPFLYRAHGLAIKQVRSFVQRFYWKKRPLFTALTTFATALRETESGQAYIPVLTDVPLPPEEAARYAALAREFIGFRAVADEEAAPDVTPDVPLRNPVMGAEELEAQLDTEAAAALEASALEGEREQFADQLAAVADEVRPTKGARRLLDPADALPEPGPEPEPEMGSEHDLPAGGTAEQQALFEAKYGLKGYTDPADRPKRR